MPDGPLIVQSDKTVLLEVDHPAATEARHALASFAELERAPEHVHTYRITNLGLWNARAAGVDAERVLDVLLAHSRYPVPHALLVDIDDTMSRYGRLRLENDPVHGLVMRTDDYPVLEEVLHAQKTADMFGPRIDGQTVVVHAASRGTLKQALLKLGWPAEDRAGYVDGAPYPIGLTEVPPTGEIPDGGAPGASGRAGRGGADGDAAGVGAGDGTGDGAGEGAGARGGEAARTGGERDTDGAGSGEGDGAGVGTAEPWQLRPYQRMAVENFWAGGSGVVVLPCGAGKTLVGAAAMATAGATTLILVTNTVSARQWKAELLRRTTLTDAEIGEYSGAVKEVRPVTIATYQVLTTKRGGIHPHLELVNGHDWGLIIYDEVHLLPAPVFRLTADLQARRRLGLTATLVREDGRESEVFSLIGPKRYDAPWKDIEAQGYIAPAECVEVRVELPRDERVVYAMAEDADKYRLCSTSEVKLPVVRSIVDRHPGEQVLVIGQYLDQLEELGELLQAPVLTGSTSVAERQRLFGAFRDGMLDVLVVSKVANFSIDLPEASVAVQVSGSYGSRQEEAQRLGRLLRPKGDGKSAHFYTVVSRDTLDQEYAQKRQRFLAEQGYAYTIVDAGDLAAGPAGAGGP